VVSDCGGVLNGNMIDDPLALLSMSVWLFAAGMWPVAFLFGACSPCCQPSDPCPWLLEFDRCLRVSVVDSDPPDGGDCRVVSSRAGTGDVEYMTSTFLQIHHVQSRIRITVRLSLSASGASRTPVGETRTQVWRFNRATPSSPVQSTYDVLGPPWHLQVDVSVTGVATQEEAGVVSSLETDEHGQPKLVLNVSQWTTTITHDEVVTLFPVGLQRWGPGLGGTQSFRLTTSSASATLTSGTSYSGWSVSKLTGLTIDERKFAARLVGTLCTGGAGGTLTERIILDDEAAVEFLNGDEELQVTVGAGIRDLRILPNNALCEASRDLVGMGVALGIYPAEIYAEAPPSVVEANPGFCQESAIFALAPYVITSCHTAWSGRGTYSPPNLNFSSLGSRNVSDFWSGRTLLWNLEQGPYRTSLTGNGPPGNTSGWVYRLDGEGGNLDPFFFNTPVGCRPGFSNRTAPFYTQASFGSFNLCAPTSISVTISHVADVFVFGTLFAEIPQQEPGVCSGTTSAGAAPFDISGTYELQLAPPPSIPQEGLIAGRPVVSYFGDFFPGTQSLNFGPPSAGGNDYIVETNAGISIRITLDAGCTTPSTQDAFGAATIFNLPGVPFQNALWGIFTTAGQAIHCNQSLRPQPVDFIFSGDAVEIAHMTRQVCEPWSPRTVPAEGATITRDCETTDTDVVTATATQSSSVGASRSRFSKTIGYDDDGEVTQLGRCRLLGLRDMRGSTTATVAATLTLGSAPAINSCFSYLPMFGETAGTLCSGDLSNFTAVPCDNCTVSVTQTAGEENGSVRLITSGDKAGLIEINVNRTWLGGQGVTFTVSCGDDTITQVVRRADTVPEAPTNLTAVRDPCSTATLAWEAPHDGGQPITGYRVEYRPFNIGSYILFDTVAANALSAVVTGLLRVGYQFRVAAISSVGTGAFSNIAVVDGFTLGAPTSLTYTRDPCDQVQLSWTPPATTECVFPANYRLEYREGVSGTFLVFGTVAGTQTTGTVTGLDPTLQYQFRVARVADAGGDLFSNTVTSGTVGAPTSLTFTRDPCDAVQLSWTAPTQADCVVVDNYRLEYREGISGTFLVFGTVAGTQTTGTVTGLDPATRYQFRVARVVIGQGDLFSSTVTSGTNPLTPTGVVAVLGTEPGEVDLTWNAVEQLCFPNTDYLVQFRPSTTSTWSDFARAASTDKFATVTGLTPATYFFRVRATNSIGNGGFSAQSNSVTIPEPE